MEEKALLKKIYDEIKIMRTDISGLKTDMSGMKTDISGLKTDVSQLKFDVTDIKIRQQEDHQILKALEHKAEVNKAEHDKMTMDMAKIEGHQKNIAGNIDALKEIIGRHEVDIAVLKRRPV